ncbi:MAG: M23 family metallopeptidase [Deltaproteobacteria bacterium]
MLATSLVYGACIPPEGDDSLATEADALSGLPLADLPNSTPVPPGYGTYCSVTDPTNGGWAMLMSGPGGDPCSELSSKVGQRAVIRRAGLWAVNGVNNAMVRCDNNVLSVRRNWGPAAANDVAADARNVAGKNCYITVSPTQLPVFGFPYDQSATVTGTSVYGYDVSGSPVSTANFGRLPGVTVCEFDRTGYGSHNCTRDAKGNLGPAPWQPYVPAYDSNEGAYDWSMARDTPILAVADGVVRGAHARPTGDPTQTLQLELFIETEVGVGNYAEHFVAAYHHMEPAPLNSAPVAQFSAIASHLVAWNAGWAALAQPTLALPPPGTKVKRGDVVGYIGTTGNSSGYHLDLSVHRLTNLTDAREYVFHSSPNPLVFASGINGWPGQIDPFGWAAPDSVDPLSYYYMDQLTDAAANPIHFGAFSINLWLNPQPATWTFGQWPLWPPTNGGASQ